LNVVLARLVDLKVALLAETRAALTDRACALAATGTVLVRGARATSSVDGWASMVLRSHVVEVAGV